MYSARLYFDQLSDLFGRKTIKIVKKEILSLTTDHFSFTVAGGLRKTS